MVHSGMRSIICLSVILQVFCFTRISIAEELTMIVHPYLPATEITARFPPLKNYLTGKTGIAINIMVSKSYKEHIQKIGNDEADIAYMGPASYVMMKQQYGPKPLLARLEIDAIRISAARLSSEQTVR